MAISGAKSKDYSGWGSIRTGKPFASLLSGEKGSCSTLCAGVAIPAVCCNCGGWAEAVVAARTRTVSHRRKPLVGSWFWSPL